MTIKIDWISIISFALLGVSFYTTLKKKKATTAIVLPNNIQKEQESLPDTFQQSMPGDYREDKMEKKEDCQIPTHEEEIDTEANAPSPSFNLREAIIANEILNRPLF